MARAVLDLLAHDPPGDLLVERRRRLAGRFNRTVYLEAHEALYERVMVAHLGRASNATMTGT